MYDVDLEVEAEYLGVGSRFGVDANTRFSGTPIGLFGSTSDAMIYGDESQDFMITNGCVSLSLHYDIGPNNFAYDQIKIWKNLDAAICVDFILDREG